MHIKTQLVAIVLLLLTAANDSEGRQAVVAA
jgi:hypothetical protein